MEKTKQPILLVNILKDALQAFENVSGLDVGNETFKLWLEEEESGSTVTSFFKDIYLALVNKFKAVQEKEDYNHTTHYWLSYTVLAQVIINALNLSKNIPERDALSVVARNLSRQITVLFDNIDTSTISNSDVFLIHNHIPSRLNTTLNKQDMLSLMNILAGDAFYDFVDGFKEEIRANRTLTKKKIPPKTDAVKLNGAKVPIPTPNSPKPNVIKHNFHNEHPQTKFGEYFNMTKRIEILTKQIMNSDEFTLEQKPDIQEKLKTILYLINEIWSYQEIYDATPFIEHVRNAPEFAILSTDLKNLYGIDVLKPILVD